MIQNFLRHGAVDQRFDGSGVICDDGSPGAPRSGLGPGKG